MLLLSRRFRELAEMVHQLADIYFNIFPLICNALVQCRDPLFKHFGTHSNRDCFQYCPHDRHHLVFKSEIFPCEFFLQVPE
jgi:hypothetical protein